MSDKGKLKTEFCKMTIDHHIKVNELRKRNEQAQKYIDDVEDRQYYSETGLFLIAFALLLITLSIAFGGMGI